MLALAVSDMEAVRAVAGLEEQLDGLEVGVGGGHVERGVALMVLHGDVNARLQRKKTRPLEKKKKKNHQERKEGKGNTWVRRTLRQLRSPVEAAK